MLSKSARVEESIIIIIVIIIIIIIIVIVIVIIITTVVTITRSAIITTTITIIVIIIIISISASAPCFLTPLISPVVSTKLACFFPTADLTSSGCPTPWALAKPDKPAARSRT